MTQQSPMQEAYTHLLHSYNPLEIKDILIHGAARKATHHKDAMTSVHQPIIPYKVALEIDIDCEELLDAIGLDYTRSEDDDTQNVVWLELDYDEFTDVFEQAPLCITNEQTLATALLNPELGEYTTKVTAYLPSGDNITFS